MEIKPTPDTDLTTFNAIRVETALSRYPVHRLAKRGVLAIDIKEANANGEIVIRWEVSHNSKYGQPGPLAYKFDTLIVNRRIEEAARPIPKIIRLGGLRELCRELDVNEGQATKNLKHAVYQNAGAFINAKIRFRLDDGTEKTLEAGFTRYSVVFTGEKLPDGRKADAIYLVLNDIYVQVINGAMTRPLDYDYLKSLPPGPQRFYELLSYQMYAAIKNDRPRAKLAYSSYCTYAPQTRYLDWEQARKQMAKVHAPHKKSGYIASVEYQQITDRDGKPDWIMLYQPGPKAMAEYRAFTRRGGPVVLEIETLPTPGTPAPGRTQLQLTLEPSPLAEALADRGVTPATAADLVRRHPPEQIEHKLEVFDWRMTQPKPPKEPAGYLVKSIEDDYATPKGFVSRAERERRAEAKRQKDQQEADARRAERAQADAERRERQRINAYWSGLTKDEQAELEQAAIAQADADELKLIEPGAMRSIGLRILRDKVIRQRLQE